MKENHQKKQIQPEKKHHMRFELCDGIAEHNIFTIFNMKFDLRRREFLFIIAPDIIVQMS